MRPLAECAEIRGGNILIIMECQGAHKCGGYIRVPFAPGINGAPDGKPSREGGCVWQRTSGASLLDLTLEPSINVGDCGHFLVQNGEVV